MSGSDLPLRPESQIFDFFDNHRNKIFIRLAKADKQAENRVKYRQVLIRYRQRSNSPKVMNYSAKVINKIGIRVQKLLGINIIKKYKIKVGIGSEWVSLDTSTVKLILDNEIWIAKVFSNSVCSDELFIPTLLNKYSEFQKKYVLVIYSIATALITCFNSDVSIEYEYKKFLLISGFNAVGTVLVSITLLLTIFFKKRLLLLQINGMQLMYHVIFMNAIRNC
ncbi:hypothetical protein E0712_04475 [Lactobacillus helveticus]|uniref:beta-1,6-N-acetylglucosaminyltransferase n=1 Tax=Lactobacillus helveticus TaxID=1587 RepID=UPI001C647361|nr:beta-1,6-N-acetylglucosaminyltransferase [Lactobacillus helveticus]MBW8013732.1 hypothetical protein [Lactobacillus helveticus]